jgi:hypothetical protein
VPAIALRPPAAFGGYTVTGEQITVRSDGTGTLTLGDRTLPLVVFGDVDCSAQLCGEPGWYELHSIVWDEAERRVIFLIAYLMNGIPGQVQLTYARSLPDLGDPIGTRFLEATWVVEPSRIRRAAPSPGAPPFGVPPPGLR